MAEVAIGEVFELVRHFRLQWEPAQNAHVLLYPEGMVKLNGPAAEILTRLDGKRTVEDLVALLSEAFPGVELRQDVIDFLEDARGRGWVRRRAG